MTFGGYTVGIFKSIDFLCKQSLRENFNHQNLQKYTVILV